MRINIIANCQLIILVFFATNALFSQTYNYDSTDTYYDFMNRNMALYEGDTAEGGIYHNLEREFLIWAPRLFPHGDMRIAAEAMHEYCIAFESSQSTSSASLAFDPAWISLGPNRQPNGNIDGVGTGRIHAIAFDPNYNGGSNKLMYCSSSFGGLFKSTDGGGNWVNLTDTKIPLNSVSDVAINPLNGNQIFITTGDGDNRTDAIFEPNRVLINPVFTAGVFRSMDGGSSWQSMNGGLLALSISARVMRRIIIHPTNPNIMYIGTSGGVFRTGNGLSTTPIWFDKVVNPSDTEFKGLEFKPDNPNTVYASGEDIYRSTDNGFTWSSITDGNPGYDLPSGFNINRINIAVTPANPDKLLAYIQGNQGGQHAYIYEYLNSSNTWSRVHKHPILTVTNGQSIEKRMPIEISPTNEFEFYYGTTRVFGTRDYRSVAVNMVSPYLEANEFHADVHGLEFDPINNDMLFAGTDGGMCVKNLNVGGENGWSFLNEGLGTVTPWAFDDSEFFSDNIIIGNQDDGTMVYRDLGSGGFWTHIRGGDGYGAQIHNIGGNLAFILTNGAGLWRYDFETSTRSLFDENIRIPDDLGTVGDAILPATFQIRNHPFTGEMYWGFSEIYRRKYDLPQADLYEGISNLGKYVTNRFNRQIMEYEISESNPNYQYLSTLGNFYHTSPVEPGLFRTKIGGCPSDYNAADCFEDITSNLKASLGLASLPPIITGIAIHPTNPEKLWVSFTGFEANVKVWYSQDAGNTWNNADPLNTLFNLPVNNIKYQDGTDDRLYIATDRGVYTKSGTSNWFKYGTQLPNSRVVEIKLNYCANKIRAATFGRGMWEGDLMPYDGFTSVGKYLTADETFDDIYVEKNLTIANNTDIFVGGTTHLIPKSLITVMPNATLEFDGDQIRYCDQDCSEVRFDIQGEVIVHNGLSLPKNSLVEVKSGGKLTINTPGLCLNSDINISVAGSGQVIINGGDFTALFKYPLSYGSDLTFVNQTVSNSYYAFNTISTNNTVSTSGTTNFWAGSSITLNAGFTATSLFCAEVISGLTDCLGGDCNSGFPIAPVSLASPGSGDQGSQYIEAVTTRSIAEENVAEMDYRATISPNPSDGHFDFILKPSDIRDLDVKRHEFFLMIYDAQGQMIHREDVDALKTQFDLSDKAQGLYFIQLRDKDMRIIHKSVVIH